MIWLRAWYQQTNSYPGPRCRDGNLLTELRISKSDCDSTMDSRLNQVLLTNDHGDVFKRQINSDECDNIQYEESLQENMPPSPTDSEYFEKPFVDYPTNENPDANLTYQNAPIFPHRFNDTFDRNNTLLNYNQHKLQQLHQNNNQGSRFTFFGYPIPTLANMWGGGDPTARKSISRASPDSNGKPRMRNFRPRPDELIDEFQFSKGFHDQNMSDKNDENNENNPEYHPYRPNDFAVNVPPHIIPNQVEKGGFIPMLPGIKGFTPINNPNLRGWENNTRPTPDKKEESLTTDSLANESVHIHDDKEETFENVENRYPVRVSTLIPEDVRQPPFPSASPKPLNTTNTFDPISTRANYTTAIQPPTQTAVNDDENAVLTQTDNIIEPRPPLLPIAFHPNGSDVINLSKNVIKIEPNDTNQTQNRNVLSALVAPGANQASAPLRIPNRSTITKVFTTRTPPVAVLPFAEEYLRNAHAEGRNQSAIKYDTTPLAITKTFSNLDNSEKEDMDWYFNSYNKSKEKEEPKSDLNRFRSSISGGASCLRQQYHFIIWTSLVCIFLIN